MSLDEGKYKKIFEEMHKYIDKGIKHYKYEHLWGKDPRFYCYVAFRMKLNDLEKEYGNEDIQE